MKFGFTAFPIIISAVGLCHAIPFISRYHVIVKYELENCQGQPQYLQVEKASMWDVSLGETQPSCDHRFAMTYSGVSETRLQQIMDGTNSTLVYFYGEYPGTNQMLVFGACIPSDRHKYILEELEDGTPLVKRYTYENFNCSGEVGKEEIIFVKSIPGSRVLTKIMSIWSFDSYFNHKVPYISTTIFYDPKEFPEDIVFGTHDDLNYKIDRIVVKPISTSLNPSFQSSSSIERGVFYRSFAESTDYNDSLYFQQNLRQNVNDQRIIKLSDGIQVPTGKCRVIGGFKGVGSDLFQVMEDLSWKRFTFSDDKCQKPLVV